MTKEHFITAYMQELKARYTWTRDLVKFSEFMRGVVTTLMTDRSTWIPEGEAVTAAWQAIGGKGKPTLKALRSLA